MSRQREYLVILITISCLIICATLVIIIWLLVYRHHPADRRSVSYPNNIPSATPSWRVFSKEEVRSITNNSCLFGGVKTGTVHGGILPDGSKVMVKRLKRSRVQRRKEFFSEIGRLSRLQHPSIVSVKGCCYDHGDRYIMYEFVEGGTLDQWLHQHCDGHLDWAARMRIVTTLAQGIAFLHDKVKPEVVHGDVRASNVVVVDDGAQLMGVGLSKLIPWEAKRERMVMAGGKHGHLAPEYVYRNELTTKSDVYAFGVLLLETVSGRRPTEVADSSVGWESVFEWATPLVQSQKYVELLDPVLVSSSPEAGVVHKVVDLAYCCTQHIPLVRPRMSHVVHQLQQISHSSSL